LGIFLQNKVKPELELTQGASSPSNQTAYDAIKAASKTVIQPWIDSSSPSGIIEHVGTREVVQDYKMIRKALGYEKIDFLGAA
jgi:hypothetical protein